MAIIGSAEIEVLANTAGFASGLKKGVAGAVGAAVAGTAGLVAAGVKQFGQFEEGINEVFTLLGADAPTETLTGIEEQVKNLSSSFGLDLQDAISGTYDAISAGVDTSNLDEFEGFTETAARFASAGATDFGTSIDLLTTATNAFGLEASDADKTADTLFATIQGGKCLRGDQRVLVADGSMVPIEDLAAGATVLAWDGGRLVERHAEWVDQGFKATVTMVTGRGRKIVTTPNHPYLTPDGWKRVDELEPGDRIAVPVSLPNSGTVSQPEHVAGLLGLWLAEGATDIGPRGSMKITSTAYGDVVKRWATEWGADVRNVENRPDAAPTWLLRADGDRWAPPAHMEWLRGLEPVRDGVKVIPDEVYRWDPDTLSVFLRWLFNGDGWLASLGKPGNYELGYCSKSETLVRGVSHLMLRFGIPGTIRYRASADAWVWQVRRYRDVAEFVRQIGIDRPVAEWVLGDPPGRQYQARDSEIEFQPVRSIEDSGVAHVYDMTVPGDENFIAEDVVAHNTTADQLAASLFQVAPIAAATGVSLEETAAGLATLTAQGVPTAAAATQLRAAFGELAKTGTKADVAFRDIAGKGFSQFLSSGGTVQEALDLLRSSADGAGIPVTDLFGSVEAGSAVLGVTGDQAERFASNLDNISDASGATEEAFDRMDSGIFASFRAIKQTIKVALVEIGDAFAPFVADIADKIQGGLPGVIDRIVELFEGPLATGVARGFAAISSTISAFQGEGFGLSGFLGEFEALGQNIRSIVDALGLDEIFGNLFGDFDGAGVGAGVETVIGGIIGAFNDLAPTLIETAGVLGDVFATQAKLAREVFVEFGPVLLDLATTVLPVLADVLGVVVEAFGSIVDNVPTPVLVGAVAAFKGLSLAIGATKAVTAAGGLLGYIKNIRVVTRATRVWTAAQKALQFVAGARSFITGLGSNLLKYVKSIKVTSLATKAWAAAQRILNLAFLTNPITLAVAAIAALTAAVVIAYKRSETFREIVQSVFEVLEPLVDVFKLLGAAFGDLFAGDFSGAFDKLREAGSLLGPFFQDLGGTIAGLLADGFEAVIGALGLTDSIDLGQVFGFVESFIGTLGSFVGDVAPTVFAALADAAEFAFEVLRTTISVGITVIGGLIRGAVALWDTGILQGIFDVLVGAVEIAWEILSGVVKIGIATVSDLIDLAVALWDTGILQGIFDVLVGAVEIAWEILSGVVKIGIATVSDLIDLAVALWDTGILQGIFDVLVGVVETVWATISSVIEVGVLAVQGYIALAQALWDTGILQGIFDVLQTVVETVWDAIAAVIEGAVEAIGVIFDGIEAVWNLPFVQAIFDGLSAVWSAALDAAQAAVETVIDALSVVFDGIGDAWEILKVEGIFGGLAAAWGPTLDAVTGVVSDAVDEIGEVLGGIGDVVGTIGGLFADAVSSIGGPLAEGVELVAQFVVDVLSTLGGWAADGLAIVAQFGIDIVSRLVADFFEGLEIIAQFVVDVLSTLGGWAADGLAIVAGGLAEILGVFTDIFGKIYDTVAGIVGDIASFIGDVFAGVRDTVSNLVGRTRDTVSDIFSDMRERVTDTLSRMRDRVAELAEQAKEKIQAPFQAVKDFLGGLLENVSLGSIDISGITGPINGAIDAVGSLIGKLNILSDIKVPSFDLPGFDVPGLALGGLTQGPSIAGEDGQELVLPLTKRDRMRAVLAKFAGLIAGSVGGVGDMIGLLAGADLSGGSVPDLLPGPFPAGRGNRSDSGSGFRPGGRGPGDPGAGGSAVTNYNFYGAEAGAVAKEIRDRRRSEIVEGVRVRA